MATARKSKNDEEQQQDAAAATEQTGDEEQAQTPPEQPKEPPALIWQGRMLANRQPAAFFAGIPARDLSQAEVDALPDGTADGIVHSGLYKRAGGDD